jgi:4-aminobutyrate aminotransferase
MIPSPSSFLPRLRAIADEYGAWLIVDEVQSGLGRTGKWWAFEHYGVVPDAIASAKALGGGWPLGATITRKPMFHRGSRHSETFSAEPRQALISLFILNEIEKQGYVQNAARMGQVLAQRLKALEAKHDCVGEARGLGLMQGVEFVESKRTKKASPAIREAVLKAAVQQERLMVLGAGDNTIRFLPALNVAEEDVRLAVEKLDRAIAAATRAS